MIVDFLKSIHEAYDKSRVEKKNELQSLSTQILETEKFLSLLESETEGSFTQFTPRNVTNRNTKKIDELTGKLSDLTDRKTLVEAELSDIESWLSDIDCCLEEVNSSSTKIATKKVQIDKSQLSSISYEKKASVGQKGGNVLLSTEDILRIANYLPADPMRARVELMELVK